VLTSTTLPPPVLFLETLARYRELGHIVIRNLFLPDEIAELVRETERILIECRELIRPENLRCRFMPHFETGEKLFEVFDPVNDISPVCARFSNDPRIHAILEAIYGEPACLFKEKLIFKLPGATGYNLHQDIPLSWDVLIPVDGSTRENGCTEVWSGYHADFLCDDPGTYMIPRHMVDDSRRAYLEMAPGDVAIFHGLTPHASEPNRSSGMRRTFYVSYNRASDGGDQRADHYARFHEKTLGRHAPDVRETFYFR
jgi:hypothetical protein